MVRLVGKCPGCGRSYRFQSDQNGKQGRCASCQRTFSIAPATEEVNSAAQSTDTAAGATAEMPLDLPRQLGRFRILAFLGSGSYGSVYRAHDEVLKRDVALKIPHARNMMVKGMSDRFLREAETAAQLHHPHIVPVFDAGTAAGQFYIASEFIDGQTLQDAGEAKAIDFRAAATLVLKLAEALAYAHLKGVVHRDVKPANVMIDRDGEPYLMDFGVAYWEQAEHKLTREGSLMGTPAYMSPEQANSSGPARSSNDQYSLAAVLYELLSGRVPFQGPVPLVLHQIREGKFPRPREFAPLVPRDLETICLKGMSHEAKDRYADCTALAEDLRRWLADEPILARQPGPLERSRRWARKNKVLAAMISTVAALLVLVSAISVLSAARMSVLRQREADARTVAEARKHEADQNAQLAETRRLEAAQQAANAEARRSEAEKNELLARERHYAGDMLVIASAWQESNFELVRLYLDRTAPSSGAPDLRSVEWHYWQRQVGRRPAGAMAPPVSAPKDNLQPTLSSGSGTLHGLALHPEGKQLAAAQGTGAATAVLIFDPATERVVQRLEHTGGLRQLTFSGMGSQLLTAGDEASGVWDLASGANLSLPAARIGISVNERLPANHAFGKGRVVAVSGDDKRMVWGNSDGKIVLSQMQARGFNGPVVDQTLSRHEGAVNALAFSPDGRRFASGDELGSCTVWDAAAGNALWTVNVLGAVSAIRFSPDGTRVAVASAAPQITAWLTEDGRPAWWLEGHAHGATHLAFSPDGQYLASGSPGVVKVWDISSRQILCTLPDCTGDMAFSLDGKRLWTSSPAKPELQYWEWTNAPRVTHVSKAALRQIVPLADKRKVAAISGGKTVYIVEPGRPESLREIAEQADFVQLIAASPVENRIAFAANNTITLWDVESAKELQTLEAHAVRISHLLFNRNGKYLVSASSDGHAVLWDAKTGKLLHELARGNVGRQRGQGHKPFDLVHFHQNDDQVVLGHFRNLARLWDCTTGVLSDLESKQAIRARALPSPDGRWGAYLDLHEIKLIDRASGEVCRTFGEGERTRQIGGFSADSKRLLTVGAMRGVQLWDVGTGQAVFSQPAVYETLASFMADGHSLVLSQNGFLRLLEASPVP